MQPPRALIALWAATLWSSAKGYRFADSEHAAEMAVVKNSSSKTSIRAFTWRGFADSAVFAVIGSHEVKVEKPFLSLPSPTQNNPCKLMVHEHAEHKLIQPSSVIKKHMVAMIKVQLVEICKLTAAMPDARIYKQQTLKRCGALDLLSEHGRLVALSSTVSEESDKEEEDGDIEDTGDEEAMKADVPPIQAIQASMSASVTTYACLATEGPELNKGINVKDNSKGIFQRFRRAVREVSSSLKGGAMGRLAKKLAGYTHGACPPFSDCPKWLSLLKHTVKAEEIEGTDACKENLISKGLMELKGIKGTRIAGIDLSKLPVSGFQREVVLRGSGSSLKLEIQNGMKDNDENVTEVSFEQDSTYAEVSSPWAELKSTLQKRIEECTVEKIGVFNMGLKRTINSFQVSERFPWKTVFLSSISIQIFTHNAHGKHLGYDLHGDPEEIERPCKWMQRALEKGYEPRKWFFWASQINFENLNVSVPLPKRLWQSDNRSLLWVDEEGKFPMPEWIRGMRNIVGLNPDKWPKWMWKFNDGRNLEHYINYMKYDVRGLHDVKDSMPVLKALGPALGWKPDPMVRLHAEKHSFWEKKVEYTEQAEVVQISAKLVTAVYPYNKQLAGLQSLPTDLFRHGGESKLFSIYDYTEAYVDSCFVLEALSLSSADDADDGWTDIGGKISASMTFCTNNFASPKRTSVPEGSAVDRKDVMQAMIDFFSKGRPDNVKVASKMTRKCSSESDCSGNTCMGPSDCKENEDYPCPVGYGCGCDTSKNQALFTVALGASLLTEVVQNSIIMGPSWIAGCTALAVGSMGALAPMCPVLMPLFFAALAPFGSDVLLAFVFASIVGGLNTCGCVPLKCSSSSTFSNSVCALNHPQGEEEEMKNPYHFVPAPSMKCVPGGALGCSLTRCNASDMAIEKVGWHVQTVKKYWHDVGVYNCMRKDFDASNASLTKAFDYKQFADEHKDLQDVQTSLVPQYQAPEKLSLLQRWTVGLPADLNACLTLGANSSTLARQAKAYAAPFCAVWSVGKAFVMFFLDMLEKLVMFAIDIVLNVLKLVRALLFSIFGVLHKHLLGKRVWRQECEAVDFSIPTAEEVNEFADGMPLLNKSTESSSMLESDSDMFGPGSFCYADGRLRPCGSLDRAMLREVYETSWADIGL